jgi:hypothetical protein
MDIVIDASCLCDVLDQYFSEKYAYYGYGEFKRNGKISKELASKLNQIMKSNSPIMYGSVITPSFSFIEIARKWDEWVKNRFSIHKMYAFINEPPMWFNISPIDKELLSFFVYVPNSNSKDQMIEWTDAIYFATTISRGDTKISTLVTSDEKLQILMKDSGMLESYNP